MPDKKFFGRIIFIIMVASIFYAGCDRTSSQRPASVGIAEGEPEHEHVVLTAEAERLAGIKLARLGPQSIIPELLVPAEVTLNPRAFYRLTTRVSGRVEQLLAYEGDRVRRGQVVARLFSLPYLESLAELRLAAERLDRLEKTNSPDKETARAVLASARDKLRLLGLADQELDRLVQQGGELPLYEVTSPADGQVVSTAAFPGDSLEAGARLMEIASYQLLWVEGRVQEKDLGLLTVGQAATIRSKAFPDLEFQGRVTFISPALDTTSRTLKVRVEVANPEGRLKPGMYVDLALKLAEQRMLAVPREAVVEVNGEKTIFVPEGPGTYRPQAIQTGPPVGDWLPVIAGLSAGDDYVAAGAFMLKAELLKHTLGEGDHHHD
ncbi:MAG: Cobalt/zinc/cadmium efflux RND transporter, membrane fusion protein, CzcB family [Candidatus Saccharicenans subterraneus]|uniref:Cobalt/zinc/cadmium efflux RND transporter, membrane fusion protein, CzcB family n=1 Tax=Candidatus Saccharicenans subterraneus TaxID=2508984 RepID=A0A3E2BQA6_9BACT|nr:MAG: Cobalt/zinc/cadmium efflux RND transporter, membrane fusion protein, CzcB family [Candidatus Saccharicenans subterraneum]